MRRGIHARFVARSRRLQNPATSGLHRGAFDPITPATWASPSVKNSVLPRRAALRATLTANLSSIGRDIAAVALRVALALVLMCALVLWLARGG